MAKRGKKDNSKLREMIKEYDIRSDSSLRSE